MNRFIVMLTATALLAPASIEAQQLTISRGGSRPVAPAPAANFTGGARVETLFEALAPSDASGAYVTFEPGARTAWHSHPRGQILIVTDGTGRAQSWGGPIQEFPSRGRRQDPGRPEALAWCVAAGVHDTPRDHRAPRRRASAVDGTGERRAVLRRVLPSTGTGPGPVRATGSASARQQGTTARRPSEKFSHASRQPGDAHRRRFVWRCVAAARVVARDRSLVTISVLIATGKPAQLAGHLGRRSTNGVQPSEASGLLAQSGHLLRLAERRLGARGLRSVVHRAEDRHRVFARRGGAARLPPPALGRGTGPRGERGADSRPSAPKFAAIAHLNEVVFDDSLAAVRSHAAGSEPGHHRRHSLRMVPTTSWSSTCAGGGGRERPHRRRRSLKPSPILPSTAGWAGRPGR